MWCIKQTQTQAQPNQARPSISSTVPMWADVLVTQHIRSVHVCVRVHIDAVRHRGVLARQRSFVYFMKHVQHGIFLYIFFFFCIFVPPFVGSSNDAITYAAHKGKSKSKLLFERFRRLRVCECK